VCECRRLTLLTVAFSLLLALCMGAQEAASRQHPQAITSAANELAKNVATQDPSYVIGSQDMLDVSVLSVKLCQNAKISLALIRQRAYVEALKCSQLSVLVVELRLGIF